MICKTLRKIDSPTLYLKGIFLNDFVWIRFDARLSSTRAGMDSLDQLTLNHNKLEHLGAGFFRGLNALTTLYVDHNQIQTVNKDAFEGLEDSLTSLTLTGNQIQEFPMLALRRIHRLQSLHLDDNKVSCTSTMKST